MPKEVWERWRYQAFLVSSLYRSEVIEKMADGCLCFVTEWYDGLADIVRSYYLNYYKEDGTVEMVDKKTRKLFLKRMPLDNVVEKDLFLGAVITIHSRQHCLVDYANDYTRRELESKGPNKLVVIKPSGYKDIGTIISSLEESDLTLLNLKMVRLSRDDVEVLVQKSSDSSLQNIGDAAALLTADVSVVMDVVHRSPEMFQQWQDKVDRDGLSRHIIFASDPDFFFDQGRDTTAVLDNCTTCIIRPHIFKAHKVGRVIQDILNSGFEISALEVFRLEMDTAEEFFGVYKGVVQHYNELLQQMASAPSVVLEVRGEDVVNAFREFCGPFDVHVAQKLRPNTIRAKFGETNVRNAVHCTDCPEDGVLETQFFFRTLQLNA